MVIIGNSSTSTTICIVNGEPIGDPGRHSDLLVTPVDPMGAPFTNSRNIALG